jgi:hypothetical protein
MDTKAAVEAHELSPWFSTCTDIGIEILKAPKIFMNILCFIHMITNIADILRFLRGKNGNVDAAFEAIVRHAKWRIGPDGADTVWKENRFINSPLHTEIFWIGLSKNDCPTFVARTFIHDGADYNEDPREFTQFITWIIEKGRREYGVGSDRPCCMIIDRNPVEGFIKKEETFDMKVIPNIVALMRQLVSTLSVSYIRSLLFVY